MTVAAFMEAALYDPEEGFYSRPAVGAERHFVTSPHVSAAFGALVARQLAESWEALGRPSRFAVVEAGAGDGTLAAQILEAVAPFPGLARALRYIAVERAAAARAELERLGIDARARLDSVPREACGVVLANELLDNLPFHLLRESGGRATEVFVGSAQGRLVPVEGDPTSEALRALASPLRSGEERAVSPAALSFVGEAGALVERGYVVAFDYEAGPSGPAVRTYAGHRVGASWLADPGSRDITAGVDFDAVAGQARARGLEVWGPLSQRDALIALGFADYVDALRARQRAAEQAGDARLAVRLYGERSRASLLVDPAHLGSLRVLALGRGGVPRPRIAS